ncbi:hypothetical protein LXL04_032265 [Taraxacum kok-saghyz]
MGWKSSSYKSRNCVRKKETKSLTSPISHVYRFPYICFSHPPKLPRKLSFSWLHCHPSTSPIKLDSNRFCFPVLSRSIPSLVMDLKPSKYLQPSHSHGGVVGARKGNPFVDTSLDPLSKLNLKETSFPANKVAGGAGSKKNAVEAPSTPGRPVFSFSVGNNVSRKNFVPSKWNDAEKWLVSDHDSANHHHPHLTGFVKPADFVSRKSSSSSSNGSVIKQQTKVISEKPPEKVPIFQEHRHYNGTTSPSESFDVLKDKFTNELVPSFSKLECTEPLSESFLFKDPSSRDIGTEMTPLGSSTTSRCPTPFKSQSPPRHNTPASRSGLLDRNVSSSLDIGELQDWHLAKLKLGTPFDHMTVSNWNSREEEEEEISKSLRHFEMNYECRTSISELPRASVWEEEEKIKCCLRYQREEAKIQAWVDLQNAKAEAQSRKLEVKIQKMRSKFEEKMMNKMALVHRKAEELRAAAQLEHTEQMEKATTEQAKKTINQHQNMHFSGHSGSCGCFPCNNLHQ